MRLLSIIFIFLSLTACQSAYYATMEQVGIQKREIMADRVESASKAQEEASKGFTKALISIQDISNSNAGEPEDVYKKIHNQYKESKNAVNHLHNRINSVKSVSDALFAEWREELNLYSNSLLKKESEIKLANTEHSYKQMLNAMKKAESKMQPVLTTLHDNTLYLKHNLNVVGIRALQNEFKPLKMKINSSIHDIKKSVEKSKHFLETLKR